MVITERRGGKKYTEKQYQRRYPAPVYIDVGGYAYSIEWFNFYCTEMGIFIMSKKLLVLSAFAASMFSIQAMAADLPVTVTIYVKGTVRTNSTILLPANRVADLTYNGANANTCDVAMYRIAHNTPNKELVNYFTGLPAYYANGDMTFPAGYTYEYVIKCYNAIMYGEAFIRYY